MTSNLPHFDRYALLSLLRFVRELSRSPDPYKVQKWFSEMRALLSEELDDDVSDSLRLSLQALSDDTLNAVSYIGYERARAVKEVTHVLQRIRSDSILARIPRDAEMDAALTAFNAWILNERNIWHGTGEEPKTAAVNVLQLVRSIRDTSHADLTVEQVRRCLALLEEEGASRSQGENPDDAEIDFEAFERLIRRLQARDGGLTSALRAISLRESSSGCRQSGIVSNKREGRLDTQTRTKATEDNDVTDPTAAAPMLFLSYSYDSEDHIAWVMRLAEELQVNGVRVCLDKWHVKPGYELDKFMETSIRESDYVVLVCTPNFAEKANAGTGGVGYEKSVITGELLAKKPKVEGKFVPILREGDAESSLPSYLKSRLFIDFRESGAFRNSLEELLRHAHQQPKHRPPPLGKKPSF